MRKTFSLLLLCFATAEPSLTVECVSHAFTSATNVTIPFDNSSLQSTNLACDSIDSQQTARVVYFTPQVSGMWSFMIDSNDVDLVMEIRLACSNQVVGCNDDLEYQSVRRTGLMQVALRAHADYAIFVGTWQHSASAALEQYMLQVNYVDEKQPTISLVIPIVVAGVVIALLVCCCGCIVHQRSKANGGEIKQAMIPTMRSPKDMESNPVFFAERRHAVSPKAAVSPRGIV